MLAVKRRETWPYARCVGKLASRLGGLSMRKIWLFTVLGVLAGWGPEARGQGRSDIESLDLQTLLDTPIASVTRREERSSLAPASVFVVPGEDIRAHGFRT